MTNAIQTYIGRVGKEGLDELREHIGILKKIGNEIYILDYDEISGDEVPIKVYYDKKDDKFYVDNDDADKIEVTEDDLMEAEIEQKIRLIRICKMDFFDYLYNRKEIKDDYGIEIE